VQSSGHQSGEGVLSFPLRISGFRVPPAGDEPEACNRLQKERGPPAELLICNPVHATFVPGRGILEWPRAHLTNLGAGAGRGLA